MRSVTSLVPLYFHPFLLTPLHRRLKTYSGQFIRRATTSSPLPFLSCSPPGNTATNPWHPSCTVRRSANWILPLFIFSLNVRAVCSRANYHISYFTYLPRWSLHRHYPASSLQLVSENNNIKVRIRSWDGRIAKTCSHAVLDFTSTRRNSWRWYTLKNVISIRLNFVKLTKMNV